MKKLYFDLRQGVAGDMLLAALTGLGGDLEGFNASLEKLPLEGLHVTVNNAISAGFAGLKATVTKNGEMPEVCWQGEKHSHGENDHAHSEGEGHHHHHHHDCRHLSDMVHLIGHWNASDRAKEKAENAFRTIAKAEAEAHGCSLEEVHFHEVGGWDSIADVLGVCWLWDSLGAPEVCGSELNLGGGTVRCAHGKLSVPAPAVALLARGIHTFGDDSFERTTPTGLALLKALGLSQGCAPQGVATGRACGIGTKVTDEFNGLQVTAFEDIGEVTYPVVAEIETWIDDMNPQDWQPLCDKLLDNGAWDFFLTQGVMKKGRPACALSLLCDPSKGEELAEILLAHSTAIGCRITVKNRLVLDREIVEVELPQGAVRKKVSKLKGRTLTESYEYEDLLHISEETGASMEEVRRWVIRGDEK